MATSTPTLESGQISTKNGMGFDMGRPSYRHEEWIASYDKAHPELPLVDIGSGLGSNVLKALQEGATVLAIDMDDDHLAEIRTKAGEDAVTSKKLETRWGQLPDKVPLEPTSVSGIMCAQVIHFLDPTQVEESFHNFHSWLLSGGKLVLLCASHYNQMTMVTGRLKGIEEAMVKDPTGAHGYFSAGGESKELMTQMQQLMPEDAHGALLPSDQHFQTFSVPQLQALAEKVGFVVEVAEYADAKLSNYPSFIVADDEKDRGREQAVLVARKK